MLRPETPLTLRAGPVSCAHLACLALCLDAVEATGQVAPADVARVAEMVAALRTLAYLQPTLDEVAPPDKGWPPVCFRPVGRRIRLCCRHSVGLVQFHLSVALQPRLQQ